MYGLLYKYPFVNYFKEELNPAYLEASNNDRRLMLPILGEEPLEVFEKIQLADDSIEKDFGFGDFFGAIFFSIILIGIPLAAIMANFGKFIFRKLLSYKNDS